MFCAEPLMEQNFRDAVKDHCHITGKYRGAAHSNCNNKLRINHKTDKIPVVFDNLRGYDSHHLMQAMSQQQEEVNCIVNNMEKYIAFSVGELKDAHIKYEEYERAQAVWETFRCKMLGDYQYFYVKMKAMAEKKEEVNCIANNMEKYITFSIGGLRFIDSLNFLQGSLDLLVSATPKEKLKITSTISKGSDLLYKKGIYPYEYMDSWERFTETRLPDKEKFYSKLINEHITDEEYAHAQAVWEAFECKTLGDYHDIYVKTDVALLADVFENFRNICQEQYGLDPTHY